ncbi:MerR family transcriptional regulator [Gordonia sp. SID5947]|uniref:DNA polymerase III subunit beta family protein n=1 Tax=Gordonia sp. SID5947 TaxID=2690315 RepID=UPI0013698925|nr:MerR family transcriptional regulator [Gordonia sp. SID5947]MYR06612.1 MerR family transcriptional regulator [Gordonia sp. SID5947]
MTDHELLTISVFARACGLTASALRFYADSGLLAPAFVDDVTGYRYYEQEQLDRAVLVRRLREMGMPLSRLRDVIDTGDPRAAAELIDDHVVELQIRARSAGEIGEVAKQSLLSPIRAETVRGDLSGIRLAAALEQVLTATIVDVEFPMLNGVHVMVRDGAITVVATDRLRLATRTLATNSGTDEDWSATIDADDLRAALSWIRRQHQVSLSDGGASVEFRAEGGARRCRTLDVDFPDHDEMLRALPPSATRVVVSRGRFLGVVEQFRSRYLRLEIGSAEDDFVVRGGTDEPTVAVSAVVSGPAIDIDFDVVNLHPAVGAAIGPEVMLEFAGPECPMIVRSADSGDLTTVAMPVRVG